MTVQESEDSWPLSKRVWLSIQTSSSLELPALSWLLCSLWEHSCTRLHSCSAYNHTIISTSRFLLMFFSPPTRNQGAVTQETDTHLTCTNSTTAPMSPWAVHWCDQGQGWPLIAAIFSFLRALTLCCFPDLCNSSWMGTSTGWKLQKAFHIKAALLFHFQLVTDKYLLLRPPKGLNCEQEVIVKDIVLWVRC